jgi:hypothetical protein
MKKKWIEYHSEEGEIWEILKDVSDSSENGHDLVSQYGNHAVLRKEMATTDFVQVTLVPAARIVDDVKGQIGREKEFYIRLDLLNEDWFSFSNRSFEKEEALKLSSYFVGMTKKQAERIWKAKKLGGSNTFRLER